LYVRFCTSFEQARFSGADAKQKAEALKMPSCDEFQERFSGKENYRS
jgi:hypothetical protein